MFAAGHGARRALTALLASALAAVGLLVPMAPQEATAALGDTGVTTVAPVDPLLGDDEALDVTVQAGTTETSDRQVTISLATTPIITRYAMSAWLADGGFASQVVIATAVLPAGQSSTTVTIDADEIALPTAGAYVLSALVDGDETSARSFVVADSLGDIGPTSIAFAGTVTAPANPTGLLDAATLERATAVGGTLGTQLQLAEQHDIALGVDPIVAASVAALGELAPASAIDWLDRVAALEDAYAIPYGGGDAMTFARAGVTPPDVLGFQGADGETIPAAAMAAAPAGTPVIDATSSSIDAELLGSLDALGMPIVSTSALDEVIDTTTPSAHASIGGVDALAVDAELQPLIDAASAGTGIEAAAARASVAALLATITLEAPNLPRWLAAALPMGDGTEALLDMLESASWLESAPLQEVLDQPARQAALVPSEPSGAELDAVARVQAALELDASTGPVLAAVEAASLDAIRVPERLALLAALGDASRLDGGSGLDALQASVDAITSGISLGEGGTALIVSDSAQVPVTLVNSLAVPVSVQVVAVAGNAIIRVDDEPIEVTIPADTQQRVVLPVEAVGTGASELHVRILAPDGQVILMPVTLEVEAQPSVELVIVIVVVGAAALLVGFGIFRSIRKRRRGDAHGSLDHDASPPAPADPEVRP